jgi:hypothetical protein
MEKSMLQEILESLIGEAGEYKVGEYSGRSMYGRKCLAVYTTNDSIHSFELGVRVGRVAALSNSFCDLEDAMLDTKEDSFGFNSVVYWPRVPYISYDESDEDGDGDLND